MKSKKLYIKNIAEFNPDNIDKKYTFSMINYIDTSSVIDGELEHIQNINLKNAPSRAKRIVKENDIIISTVRPNLKHYYFVKTVKKNTIVSTGFVVIRAIKVNPLYLYYFLTTPAFTLYLTNVAESHTTTYPSFPIDIIENTPIYLPSIHKQKKIIKILIEIDNQIENFRNQNKLLEQMVQAIFKSWFVDFDGITEFEDSELGKIPKGWKIDILKNYIELTRGVSYRSKDLILSNKALVTLKSIKRYGGYTDNGLKSYDGKYNDKQIVRENDIIIAQTDLTQNADVIGRPAIVHEANNFKILIASLDLSILRTFDNKFPNTYLYYLLLSTKFQNYIQGYASGTTVLHLSNNAILNYYFLLPSDLFLKKFDILTSSIIKKIHINNYKIKNLLELRNTLLPKLMSGEIKV